VKKNGGASRKPNSVPTQRVGGDHLSRPGVTVGLKRPTRDSIDEPGRFVPAVGRIGPLFGLAGGGVCPAGPVAGTAVSSYLAFSPLPILHKEAPAVFFLWHFPWGCPRWMLSTTVPCPVRTFLPVAYGKTASTERPPETLRTIYIIEEKTRKKKLQGRHATNSGIEKISLGQDDGVDGGGPGRAEGPRSLKERGPGGHHIVHQAD